MISILSFIVFLLLLYKFYSFVTTKPGKLSPPGEDYSIDTTLVDKEYLIIVIFITSGPLRFPLWGSYWFLLWGDYKFPYKTALYYTKKFKSKIIGLYLGSQYTIVVNDYDTVKEVLSRKEFDGRLHEIYVTRARTYGKKLGIFFNDQEDWLLQRRFTLRTMRDFGFGRRHDKLECVVANEIAILVDTLRNGSINEMEKKIVADGSALFPDVLFASSANPIWYIMSGEILEREDYEKLRHICRCAFILQRAGNTAAGPIAMTPWLRHFGDGFGYKGIVDGSYGIIDFFKDFVNERKSSSIDDEDNSEGLIDAYRLKLKESVGKSGFSEEQMYSICGDVIFPALSAVPGTITFYIKYMMHYPEVRKKVQQEIDDVVGRSRFPEWNDRKNLPYTEAVIREVFRIETVTPWSVPHRTYEATTLGGYDVPANTAVVTNLAAMHNDPDLWGDPENFRPERFLTNDGKSLGKDFTLPFGFGKRICAGETFARFILFAHFAALMQNFNFEFVKGQPTSLEDSLSGLITTPRDTWIRVVAR